MEDMVFSQIDFGLLMPLLQDDDGDDQDMIEGIADVTLVMPGGYKVLQREEIVDILRESLA